MSDLEKKRQKIETVAKVGVLGILGFLVFPFIVKSILGLAGLVVFIVFSLVVVNVGIPWFGKKLSHWRINMLKAAVMANPLAELEAQFETKQQALIDFREHIKKFHAQCQNFYSQLEGFREKYPNNCQKWEEQYSKMSKLLKSQENKYKGTHVKLKQFAEVIEQKRVEWEMQKSLSDMSNAAGLGEDFMSKLLVDTAINTITTELNTELAELNTLVLDEEIAADEEKSKTVTVTVHPSEPVAPKALAERAGPPTLELDFLNEPKKEFAPSIKFNS